MLRVYPHVRNVVTGLALAAVLALAILMGGGDGSTAEAAGLDATATTVEAAGPGWAVVSTPAPDPRDPVPAAGINIDEGVTMGPQQSGGYCTGRIGRGSFVWCYGQYVGLFGGLNPTYCDVLYGPSGTILQIVRCHN